MSSSSERGDSQVDAPFLVRLFYKTGTFFRPEDFTSASLPSNICVYVGVNSTLYELALELADVKASALPVPSTGTRLVFQLVSPDLRATGNVSHTSPRYSVKDLGSVVIGESGSGVKEHDTKEDISKPVTLSSGRFVIGDYISCAILPPLEDGSVASAASAKRDVGLFPRNNRGGYRGRSQGQDNGYARTLGRGGWGGRNITRDAAGSDFSRTGWRRGGESQEPTRGWQRGQGRW